LRTHGGAISVGRSRAELAFEVRARLHKTEKSLIGAEAARLVEDGDSIALDASSTALQIARHLKARRELTVVTNGIRVATEMATFCPTNRLRLVISDDRAPIDSVKAARDLGIDVRLVGSK